VAFRPWLRLFDARRIQADRPRVGPTSTNTETSHQWHSVNTSKMLAFRFLHVVIGCAAAAVAPNLILRDSRQLQRANPPRLGFRLTRSQVNERFGRFTRPWRHRRTHLSQFREEGVTERVSSITIRQHLFMIDTRTCGLGSRLEAPWASREMLSPLWTRRLGKAFPLAVLLHG